MRLALVLCLLPLSGCRFVQVRYRGNGETAPVKECHVDEGNPNALVCWDYVEQRLRGGGPVREL